MREKKTNTTYETYRIAKATGYVINKFPKLLVHRHIIIYETQNQTCEHNVPNLRNNARYMQTNMNIM